MAITPLIPEEFYDPDTRKNLKPIAESFNQMAAMLEMIKTIFGQKPLRMDRPKLDFSTDGFAKMQEVWEQENQLNARRPLVIDQALQHGFNLLYDLFFYAKGFLSSPPSEQFINAHTSTELMTGDLPYLESILVEKFQEFFTEVASIVLSQIAGVYPSSREEATEISHELDTYEAIKALPLLASLLTLIEDEILFEQIFEEFYKFIVFLQSQPVPLPHGLDIIDAIMQGTVLEFSSDQRTQLFLLALTISDKEQEDHKSFSGYERIIKQIVSNLKKAGEAEEVEFYAHWIKVLTEKLINRTEQARDSKAANAGCMVLAMLLFHASDILGDNAKNISDYLLRKIQTLDLVTDTRVLANGNRVPILEDWGNPYKHMADDCHQTLFKYLILSSSLSASQRKNVYDFHPLKRMAPNDPIRLIYLSKIRDELVLLSVIDPVVQKEMIEDLRDHFENGLQNPTRASFIWGQEAELLQSPGFLKQLEFIYGVGNSGEQQKTLSKAQKDLAELLKSYAAKADKLQKTRKHRGEREGR